MSYLNHKFIMTQKIFVTNNIQYKINKRINYDMIKERLLHHTFYTDQWNRTHSLYNIRLYETAFIEFVSWSVSFLLVLQLIQGNIIFCKNLSLKVYKL